MAQYPFAHSRSMMHELPFGTCPTKTWSHAAGEGGGADWPPGSAQVLELREARQASAWDCEYASLPADTEAASAAASAPAPEISSACIHVACSAHANERVYCVSTIALAPPSGVEVSDTTRCTGMMTGEFDAPGDEIATAPS
jgi:hypothetical protein